MLLLSEARPRAAAGACGGRDRLEAPGQIACRLPASSLVGGIDLVEMGPFAGRMPGRV